MSAALWGVLAVLALVAPLLLESFSPEATEEEKETRR